MTRSPTDRPLELPVTPDDRRVARYAAAAIALTVAEAAIPLPLPGVKPGLANIVVLLVLLRHGWREAAWVALLRVFAGSLLMGQFLAPGFFLSLTGALLSLGALALAAHLPRRVFGPVTLSLVGAFAHIGGQVLLARFWLVPHNGVFYLVPVFTTAALIFGIVNGLVAAALLRENSA
ncbi:heptaprenyl diphosphate synthase [Denitratisoma sp. DHT3]|uniref:Gx transporter family protein n=1 Tax=Denitratisoma sp. DHT3 TaxID=1981880 RepID=UPI001198A7F0|nr:Gx transporter family protein [Denitratisoma sp. DHT3]QDX82065.1 heptaprenyl diphosphate synthase [Denitratisoma sp. DHT3]